MAVSERLFMLKVRACLWGLLIMYVQAGSAYAADTQQQSFEASLFGISEISHFGLDEQRFNQLSIKQRVDVLQAKELLFNLFKSIQNKDGKPQQYLSSALNKKFPTKREFVQSLVDEETSLLAMIIGDFSIGKGGNSIVFHFSIISSTEGIVAVTEKTATVQNFDEGWKVAKI